jgi:Skp family chaperone for outer membrane proteins
MKLSRIEWLAGFCRTGLLVVAALATPAAVHAQTEGSASKFGVFNADRVLAESQVGAQALAQLEQLRNQRVTELQAQQDELNMLRQQALAATGLEANQLQRQLEDKGLQLQRLQEDVQQELAIRQQELTQGIIQRVSEIIDEIGQAESYTMIFNSVQSGLVYVDEAVDITPAIIARLDAAPTGGPGGGGR